MKGKLTVGFFKVMAVVSALAIGGGYVAWRQAEAEKANKRARIEQAKAGEDMTLIVGSKSIDAVFSTKQLDSRTDADSILPELEEVQIEEAPLLPGSKSISMPLFTKEQIEVLRAQDESGKEVEILPEDLLPSSKIGILRLPEAEPPEEKATELLPGSKSFLVIPKETGPENTD